MTLKAKPVVKDKFWIVENNNEKIGTLSWNDDRYIYSSRAETCFFDNTRQLKKKFGVDIEWGIVSEPSIIEDKEYYIHGYPTSVTPYNTIYDVKRKLPLFTKSVKSKSLYCAGYYIIQFDKGWVKSFCPKQITVERYKTKGPFKTDLEMRQELSIANR
tara:strand:+ start:51 stop:524 length:474 start_codon:yes stop_codon:yes gene_type:complete